MLIIKRQPGESLAVFDPESRAHIADLDYVRNAGNGRIIIRIKLFGTEKDMTLTKGDALRITDPAGKVRGKIWYSEAHRGQRRAVFSIAGNKSDLIIMRRELCTAEGVAKEEEKRNAAKTE